MLDQQVAPARTVGEQRFNLCRRLRVDLAALGRPAGTIARTPDRRGRLLDDAH
jgi:hypothetical protein